MEGNSLFAMGQRAFLIPEPATTVGSRGINATPKSSSPRWRQVLRFKWSEFEYLISLNESVRLFLGKFRENGTCPKYSALSVTGVGSG